MFSNQISTDRKRRGERGSMLLEVLISMVVLSVGLGGLLSLLVSAMYTDSKSSKDTTSTMVAEHVLEQISAQPANAGATALSVTDCAGTNWSITTAGSDKGAGSGTNGGNGANLTSSGNIDWAQSYSGVPTGYKMKYVSCGAGGRQTTYDIRWDVMRMSDYARMVVISARPDGSKTIGGLKYIVPVNLRTIGGIGGN